MPADPAPHEFGLFGEDFGFPPGGLCLSSFVIARRQGKLLVGRMAKDHEQAWIDRWAPNLAYYEGKRRERLFEGYRLPATYLQVGEDPRAAAQRVFGDQLGFDEDVDVGEVEVSSTSKPSRRSPEAEHWDVFFTVEVQGPPLGEVPDHWAELTYADLDRLAPDEFVMMHGDLVDRFED